MTIEGTRYLAIYYGDPINQVAIVRAIDARKARAQACEIFNCIADADVKVHAVDELPDGWTAG